MNRDQKGMFLPQYTKTREEVFYPTAKRPARDRISVEFHDMFGICLETSQNVLRITIFFSPDPFSMIVSKCTTFLNKKKYNGDNSVTSVQ